MVRSLDPKGSSSGDLTEQIGTNKWQKQQGRTEINRKSASIVPPPNLRSHERLRLLSENNAAVCPADSFWRLTSCFSG